MADPTLLICVGATKAGTSWMYRYLHDHEAYYARSVKECHYFSTFNPKKLSATVEGLEPSDRPI